MMGISSISKNPFQITTPEDLSAQEVVDLFVDVFTDFPKIVGPGHVFLLGPRGVGKSMMFRYLQTDCQCLVSQCSFSQLPFVGIYIPIKNESFVKTELKRLEDRHASEVFNEHLMVSHFCAKIFDSLLNNQCAIDAIDAKSLISYYKKTFIPTLYPYNPQTEIAEESNVEEILSGIIFTLNCAYKEASIYINHLSYTTNSISLPNYTGPLFDYQDFLVPLISGLSKLSGFPQGTVYLLIDDAHFLSETQTKVLNSWIATRTSKKISLKVSSQYDYKTYYTVTGAIIESPHDYSEVDMSTVYTAESGKSNYRSRIYNIVEKRLKMSGINIKVEDFFPFDKEQEEGIKKIEEKYKSLHDAGEGRGFYRSDDAIRYARPDFIKSLAGKRKSSSSYSYSGFDQLVHLSSGIARYFLEPAHIMYSKAKSENGEKGVELISTSIQNEVARDEAENFLFFELDKYKTQDDDVPIAREDIEHLSNLVQGLGGLFRQILLSERSERKVFSIAISDNLTEDVERVLNIGVNFGYFHRSTIGRKNRQSGGRTRLFVMNRRLAPIWTLDPTGFAGYLFVKNQLLQEGMENPQRMLRRIEKSHAVQSDKYFQTSVFNIDNEQSEELFEVVGEEV